MAVNCRAVLKQEPGRSADECFKIMLGKFRKKVSDTGVVMLYKQKQFYESKGEVRRRKKKESILRCKKEQSKLGRQ